MEWMTLISTLSGAVLGVASALVVDAVRVRRDRSARLLDARRVAYVHLLVALTETDAAIQLLALNNTTPIPHSTVQETFRSKSLLARRYEIGLVGPASVATAAEAAYQRLRAVAVAIATTPVAVSVIRDGRPDNPEWNTLHQPYADAIAELRTVMKRDMAIT
jgi:hypothetical protein